MSVGSAGRGRGIPRSTRIDQQLPDRRPGRRDAPDSDDPLAEALAALESAASENPATREMTFRIDRDLGLIVVLLAQDGAHRVLRQIHLDEAQRLTRLIRAGRQLPLDRNL